MQGPVFWFNWLQLAAAGTALFGLAFVVLPGTTAAFFNWMIFGAVTAPADFSAQAQRYTSFVYAVLGAVMFGWGGLMLMVVRGPLRRALGDGWRGEGWRMLALALLLWFVPDTAYSLLSGYWPNAVLNSVFALVFGVPLAVLARPAPR